MAVHCTILSTSLSFENFYTKMSREQTLILTILLLAVALPNERRPVVAKSW